MYEDFLGYFESMHFQVKTTVATFLLNFLNN